MDTLLQPKWIIVALYIASALYVHFRGKVRHGFVRQLTDHSTLLAPGNVFLYLSSAVPKGPFLDPALFPELQPLTDHWQVIRDEARAAYRAGAIKAARDYNDIGFNSFFRKGWTRFYLKWYDQPLPSAAAMCPRTVELVQAIPTINGAMFAVLPPGGKLGKHRDPYAGSLRYHLGLDTPNSPDCAITVDGETRAWRDGEAMIFDETLIHDAHNTSDKIRIILFCDLVRPVNNPVARWFNKVFSGTIMRATATENVPGEHIGFLGRMYTYVYPLRLWGKRLKAKSRFAHYALKYALLGGVIYLLLR
jgi:beta-hydroxylase